MQPNQRDLLERALKIQEAYLGEAYHFGTRTTSKVAIQDSDVGSL